MKNQYWIIKISSWGTLYGFGTEEQAEEWRRAKCNWERSTGTKRLADKEEITINKWESLQLLLP